MPTPNIYIYTLLLIYIKITKVYITHLSALLDSWADRTPLHDAALQGRLLPLRKLLSQVLMEETRIYFFQTE